ncbi:hypothetical protein NVP1121O_011 [Vibrio phage 1.121.O._10N.286.46.C4]|nr:hypothetical protein NVP1121O_011 [Vibrio phage 1.121.O._10N.286.46.C4]
MEKEYNEPFEFVDQESEVETPVWTGIDWAEVFKLSQRRELLGVRMNYQKLSCPECDTRQVQLIGYINIVPAVWKCRGCKHEFEWEGDKYAD